MVRRGHGPDDAKTMRETTSGMGEERVALRARPAARRIAVALLHAASFACLAVALASFAGFYVPHAVGLSVLLVVTAVVGFALSVVAARVS